MGQNVALFRNFKNFQNGEIEQNVTKKRCWKSKVPALTKGKGKNCHQKIRISYRLKDKNQKRFQGVRQSRVTHCIEMRIPMEMKYKELPNNYNLEFL